MEILERFTNIIKHKPLLPMPKIKWRNTRVTSTIKSDSTPRILILKFKGAFLAFFFFEKNYYWILDLCSIKREWKNNYHRKAPAPKKQQQTNKPKNNKKNPPPKKKSFHQPEGQRIHFCQKLKLVIGFFKTVKQFLKEIK